MNASIMYVLAKSIIYSRNVYDASSREMNIIIYSSTLTM